MQPFSHELLGGGRGGRQWQGITTDPAEQDVEGHPVPPEGPSICRLHQAAYYDSGYRVQEL